MKRRLIWTLRWSARRDTPTRDRPAIGRSLNLSSFTNCVAPASSRGSTCQPSHSPGLQQRPLSGEAVFRRKILDPTPLANRTCQVIEVG